MPFYFKYFSNSSTVSYLEKKIIVFLGVIDYIISFNRSVLTDVLIKSI